MPDQNEMLLKAKVRLFTVGYVFLSVLVIMAVIGAIRGGHSWKGGMGNGQATITVAGRGEVMASPDVAEISFGVVANAPKKETAVDEATKKNNAVVAYLKQAGVAEKDIKAVYSLQPQYNNQFNGNNQLTVIGFQARFGLAVTVRDLDQVGTIISGVTGLGVNEISGPNFIVDDEVGVKADARAKAIADAEAKAKRLAKDLDVRLVRVLNFNEDSGPIYYAKAMMAPEVMNMGGDMARPIPDLPAGENQIVSNVSITYEIR